MWNVVCLPNNTHLAPVEFEQLRKATPKEFKTFVYSDRLYRYQNRIQWPHNTFCICNKIFIKQFENHFHGQFTCFSCWPLDFSLWRYILSQFLYTFNLGGNEFFFLHIKLSYADENHLWNGQQVMLSLIFRWIKKQFIFEWMNISYKRGKYSTLFVFHSWNITFYINKTIFKALLLECDMKNGCYLHFNHWHPFKKKRGKFTRSLFFNSFQVFLRHTLSFLLPPFIKRDQKILHITVAKHWKCLWERLWEKSVFERASSLNASV